MPPIQGLKKAGNINLYTRPRVPNNGGVSTVYSMGVGLPEGEVLMPQVDVRGRGLKLGKEAVQQYRDTGQHLGIFETPADTERYGQDLHNAFEEGAFDVPLATSRRGVNPNQLERVLKGLLQSGPYTIPGR